MKLITKDDFIETYSKLHQRGLGFILSKFNLNPQRRVRSTFNDDEIQNANWWIIPTIRERWNEKISGDKDKLYEDYVTEKYFQGRSNLKMLSLGSGICSHELRFAQKKEFGLVECTDIADKLLNSAEQKAKSLGLNNMKFKVDDIRKIELPYRYYDVVLFHSSLHHFKNVEKLIGQKVKETLRENGLLIIHEYVGPNRIQWTEKQICEANRVLKEVIPEKFKRRFKTNKIKSSLTGPGLIRMFLSDPSEAIESEKILPIVKNHFSILEEKNLGGNILMLVLKDIAQNFLNDDRETNALLQKLFDIEDEFLKTEPSNLIFGVYRK